MALFLMSQLTIYLDKDTAKRLAEAARRDGVSVSRWARDHLKSALDRGWPREFFELFGSITDEAFQRPDQPSPEDDAPREEL